jgi:hypothetical protein
MIARAVRIVLSYKLTIQSIGAQTLSPKLPGFYSCYSASAQTMLTFDSYILFKPHNSLGKVFSPFRETTDRKCFAGSSHLHSNAPLPSISTFLHKNTEHGVFTASMLQASAVAQYVKVTVEKQTEFQNLLQNSQPGGISNVKLRGKMGKFFY